jgi:Uma2 family endonuclease
MAPAEKLAQILKRIDFIVEGMERAIANHEFEKARFYSDEERKERENLRALREQFNFEEPPPRVPLLCIEVIRDERFSEVQKRCDDYIAEGVTQVWLLDPDFKRAYTVTKTEGLREFKGGILQIADPPLEMDLRRIFD